MKRSIFTLSILIFIFSFFLCGRSKGDYPKEYLVNKPIQEVWDKVHDTLKKLKYKVKKEDKASGVIITEKISLLSGVEASDQLKKIARVPSSYTTLYEGGYYFLEIHIKFLGAQKTLVTPYCHIKAQKVSVEGKKEWVNLKSNWVVEYRFLNQLSILLTGKPLPKRYRNFWDRDLREIDLR